MKYVVVISGPTAVGKTALSIAIAQYFNTEIISADSRQFFKEIPIGTAAPSYEEMNLVHHHCVGNLSITDYYNAFKFEQDALQILSKLFNNHDIVIVSGGSGLYI
nr:isopentenyl transferase family protein [Bacteroidales bacterium]